MKKIYLAIPYTGMQESSYRQANVASVAVLNEGYNVFSPITHSHPLAQLEGLNVPHTWEYWSQIDYQFLDWADEMWVVVPEEGMKTVLDSTGVNAEIEYAVKQGMVIRAITCEDNRIEDYVEEGMLEDASG